MHARLSTSIQGCIHTHTLATWFFVLGDLVATWQPLQNYPKLQLQDTPRASSIHSRQKYPKYPMCCPQIVKHETERNRRLAPLASAPGARETRAWMAKPRSWEASRFAPHRMPRMPRMPNMRHVRHVMTIWISNDFTSQYLQPKTDQLLM